MFYVDDSQLIAEMMKPHQCGRDCFCWKIRSARPAMIESANMVEAIQVECKRARVIIQHCEASPEIRFAAIWLDQFVKLSEQAIAEQDVVRCVACLKELRAVWFIDEGFGP